MAKTANRIFIYIEICIDNLEDEIKKEFVDKLGKTNGEKRFVLINSFYKPFLRAKIDTEVNKLSFEQEKKQIDIRENNWEYLCKLLDEDFDKQKSSQLKSMYKSMAQKEKQEYILFNSNIFKKIKVKKEISQEMKMEGYEL